MNVYLDNSATTPVCYDAAEKVYEIMTHDFGNPSSTHLMGRTAKKELDAARKKVASAIGCTPNEVYFTSGGTEADNLAIFGACSAKRHFGKHIITTKTEHDAVLRAMEYMEKAGWSVTYLTPDKTGAVPVSAFEEAVREDTVFASVMLVNNETGAVNDIKAMADILHRKAPKALFHTDAVQGFCKMDISPRKLGADLISVSAHKIHGPKGVGALYVKNGVRIDPVSRGGGQENSLRSGTEALPLIAGFGVAAELAKDAMAEAREKFSLLRNALIEKIKEAVPDAVIIGGGADHILCVSLPGYRSEVLLNYLDAQGVYISKGSACKKGARSHVLQSMNLPPKVIDSAVRISFSRLNTLEEIEYTGEMIKKAAFSIIRT